MSCYGVKEIPGTSNNPDIMLYFERAGHTWVNSEATPWCSAFMCYVFSEAGLEHPGSLRARNWLRTTSVLDASQRGEIFDTNDFIPGDLVVLWRENRDSNKGHVGLFVSADDKYVYLLGGNQNNSVCVKRYFRFRVLAGFRYSTC
jgi:uncharacterized protein (TIGR02594 family)